MLALSAAVWVPAAEAQADRSPWWVVLDVVVGVACLALVGLRRRRPVTVALVVSALAAVSGVAAGAAVLAAVSLATRRRWREIVPVALVSLTGNLAFGLLNPAVAQEPLWLTLSVNVVATTGVFGWGMYLGSRRELIWTLQQRAERAEAEQELRTSQARGNERARIAREMHDVLAHRISQISMHAGALAFREGLDAEQMRESAAVIQDKAHEALIDLRGVLGVLREPPGATGSTGGEGSLVPQPTYADLSRLVADARLEGVNVDLLDQLECPPDGLPDPVGRALYRIVQEGLTNARKHAPGAAVHIRLTGRPGDGLRLHVANPLGFGSGTPGSGLGLVGVGERAALLGGHLQHHYEQDTFVLDTWIPWAA